MGYYMRGSGAGKMLQLTDEQRKDLANAVRSAAGVDALSEAIGELYRRVQDEIDRRRPACAISGRCCRFEEYGHRLFVTTIELAVFSRQLLALPIRNATTPWDGQGCPFQVKGLCGVHSIRPFGCRAFFCDPTATQWMEALYEQFHAELRRLHEQHEIPYFYVEWRQGLAAMGLDKELL